MYKIKKSDKLGILKFLQKECFPDDKIVFPDGGQWWICWQRTQPVGFIGWCPDSDTDVYICRVGVLEGHRGKGLMKRMVRTSLNKAKLDGYSRAITDTRKNPASANAFISCGFKSYEPENPWAFRESTYWKKDL